MTSLSSEEQRYVDSVNGPSTSTRCSCTPSYTRRGMCITKDVIPQLNNIRKRAYTLNWTPIGKHASGHQHERMSISSIEVSVATYAY